MYTAEVIGDDWLSMKGHEFKRPVELYNMKITPYSYSKAFKVLHLSSEPEPFRVSNQDVIAHAHQFDLILTYDVRLLSCLPNARLFTFGTSWLNNADAAAIKPEDKKFQTSFVCGHKRITAGHLLRQNLWHAQNLISTPHTFWNSSKGRADGFPDNPVLMDSKMEMFREFQFHIAIENTSEQHYFSEKLTDALVTQTVPIYWGCPNIGDYLDTSGIIQVYTLDELIDRVNRLTPNDYLDRLAVIAENKRRCLEHIRPYGERIAEKIREVL